MPALSSTTTLNQSIPPSPLVQSWRELFSQVQTLKLPTDYPRTFEEVSASTQTGSQQNVTVITVPQEFVWTKEHELPLNVLSFCSTNEELMRFVLSSFAVLLSRYTSEESFLIGTSGTSSAPFVHCRLNSNQPETQNFVNTSSFIKSFLLETEKLISTETTPIRQLLSSLLAETGENAPQMIQASFGVSEEIPFASSTSASQFLNELESLIKVYQGVDFHLQLSTKNKSVSFYYQKGLFSEERVEESLRQTLLIMEQAASFPNKSVYDYTLVSSSSAVVLPHPKAQLNAKWKGSVVYFLEKQAATLPDKVAVVDNVESLSYKKLNALANKLARQLLQLGIQKGNTVAIFGHRSVAIVWAVAGILKAGASFTVIDPAYPPQRIIDCITVAGPVGAIVIDAIGKLPAKVEKFMSEQVTPDSQNTVRFVYRLKRPSEAEKENTPLLSHSGDNLPEIELTPNDIAVVTFTSGSTGIPKGVLGRHGPLTQYYPWMKEKFGFTCNERFSMQSGIAHDPLQRDIFTPWFLGATLYVPHPDDIVNPGRLSRWFQEKKITITHLTPAMGQLLTTGSGAGEVQDANKIILPDLRYAFFVGDVLGKKFVRRLCSIAPSISVINIYGSTETQRSVSYFVVPRPTFTKEVGVFERLKDIIPVGKGMDGLQALVLSRFTTPSNKFQLSGVGELGEIYMRSSHLSLGYRGKPEETAEKFIYNPFVSHEEAVQKGDRMYKTGDLGRFLPSGDVECLGRADDQVKIRGFRIELGEINTALNSHNYVKESVTIVRNDLVPNLPDEKRIVSYIVLDGANPVVQKADQRAEEQKLKKGDQLTHYSALVKELREYLRSKLPEYMIPSAFVVLPKIPLTPNGKIKKEALPKPDPSTYFGDEDFIAPRTPLEKLLAEIWTSVLGVMKMGIHDNFFDLGGHSISATTLTLQVREAVSHANKLPVEALYKHPTIAEMAAAIENLKSGNSSSSSEPTQPVHLLKDSELDPSIIPECTEWIGRFNPIWTSPNKLFLTGCTGFLGAFLLSDLLKQTGVQIYCLVRAPSVAVAYERIKKSLISHDLMWYPGRTLSAPADLDAAAFDDFLKSRVVSVTGDLSKPNLGLTEEMFDDLGDEVDVIIHNGAIVHWMYPYDKMRAANVLGTQEVIRLACRGKLKPIHYISTTSVFDSNQYNNVRDVFEGSDLPFWEDLRGGYPQTKYVAEKLIINARKVGVPSCIYRPGYVTGHSKTGMSNPDDFLCRMVKGCILLGSYPDMGETKLDMTPVDYISGAVVYLFRQEFSVMKHKAYHMVNPNEFFFNALFDTGVQLGYRMTKLPLEEWRALLIRNVEQDQQQQNTSVDDNPLYPLMSYFSDDFETRMKTKRPWYDNTNMLEGMSRSDIEAPSVLELISVYYRFLCQCGFLMPPQSPTALATHLGFLSLIPARALSDNVLGTDGESSSGTEQSPPTTPKRYIDLMRNNRD